MATSKARETISASARKPREQARPHAGLGNSPSTDHGAILEAKEPLLAQTSIKIVRSSARHGYAQLLGIHDSSASHLHESVKEGLAYTAMEKLQSRLDPSLVDLSQIIHIPARTLQRRKVEGRLQPDESDRLLRFARVLWKTIELFEGDLPMAVQWLVSPVAGLGKICPIELAQSEPGTLEVEALIGRLEHGVFA